MTETSFTYWGHFPCGCLIWAAVDCPQMAQMIARETLFCVKRGFPVDRIETEKFKKLSVCCEKHKAKQETLHENS